MSNEAETFWRSRPAGEIVDESQRLIDLLTTWGIDEPQLVSDLQFIHTKASEMGRESFIQDQIFGILVDTLFRRVADDISTKKRDIKTRLIHGEREGAAFITRWAFEEKQEEKAKEAHKKERKKAYQKALKNKGLGRANDKKCKEDARKETDWSWFDLQDTEHQQPYIERELESLKGWKKGSDAAKPPTPVLDRLYFCLKESGTDITLESYVEACTWNARYHELTTTHHTRGGPPKLRDFVNESDVLETQPIFDLIQAKVAKLDKALESTLITQAIYGLSRALVDQMRVMIENLSPDEVQEAVNEAKAIRSTKEKLEQAYESELRVPSSIVRGRERYKGLLMGNPVDHALSRAVELPE